MVRFFSLFLVLLFLCPPTLTFAAKNRLLPAGEISARQQDEFARKRFDLDRLKEGIGEQQQLRGEAKAKEQEILTELENINRQLAERKAKLNELDQQIPGQEELLRKLDADLKEAGVIKDKAMHHLMRRIRAFYPTGKVGLLGVTFSRKNLPDLLKFHEAFTTLIRYDERILADYRKKYEELRAARDSQRLEQSVLADFRTKIKDEQTAIEGMKQERELFLERLKTQVDLRQRAIKEMGESAAKMTASLQTDIRKEEDRANDFTRFKGQLPPPVKAPIICRFGEKTTNKMGIAKESPGLVFAAADGETARAVAPGVVLFAGYLLGYGNTVLIQHGKNFYTVTAHLERIDRAKGDAVKAGDAIGAAGATAMLVNEGLYFELREGQKSIDPTPWFDSGQISFATLPTPQ